MKISDYWLNGLLAFVCIIIAISFYRMHRKKGNTFNLLDLLLENGRVSRIAVAFMAALIATTWVFIKLTVDGKMTENYLLVYGGMWVAPIISKMLATNQVSSSSTSSSSSSEVIMEPKK